MQSIFRQTDQALPATVLIVDDTPKNLKLLASVLDTAHYNISMATSGAEALAICQELIPDLILLDIMMPEMDGFEVNRQLKQDPRLTQVPVIFVSAKSELNDKIQGFQTGAVDYITKPFQPAELLARVQTHLELTRARETIRAYSSELEVMLEKRTRELIQAERHAAFSLLMKGIIHNLKNPLTVVLGSNQLLALLAEEMNAFVRDLPKNRSAEYKQALTNMISYSSSIERSGKNLLDLIDSMMAKSRNDQTAEATTMNMDELIKQELEFLKTDLRYKNLFGKDIQLSGRFIPVHVVPGEFSQVLQNLVQNALDAMHRQAEARLEIRSGRTEKMAWFTVADNGPGIPAELRQKIFEPFFTTKKAVPEPKANKSRVRV